MSVTITFVVKIQLKGGTSVITLVHAESDFRARQLVKVEWEGKWRIFNKSVKFDNPGPVNRNTLNRPSISF